MSEDDIINGLINQDQDALRDLFAQHRNLVYATAYNHLENANDAEEITQDTFITAFRKIAQFRRDASLQTWLVAIARNKSLSLLDKMQRRKIIVRSVENYDLLIDVLDDANPSILLEKKETRSQIFKATDLLPEKQKNAFIYRYIEFLSPQEIAEIMDTSIGAVESLLQRAKANLRVELNRCFSENNIK